MTQATDMRPAKMNWTEQPFEEGAKKSPEEADFDYMDDHETQELKAPPVPVGYKVAPTKHPKYPLFSIVMNALFAIFVLTMAFDILIRHIIPMFDKQVTTIGAWAILVASIFFAAGLFVMGWAFAQKANRI